MDIEYIKELYANNQYGEIVEIAQKFAPYEVEDIDVLTRVADSFYKLGSMQMSALWQERLVELNSRRRHLEKLSDIYQKMDATKEQWENLLYFAEENKIETIRTMAAYQKAKREETSEEELYKLALAAAKREYSDTLFFELAALCERVGKEEETKFYLEKIRNNSDDADSVAEAERLLGNGFEEKTPKAEKGIGKMLSKMVKGKRERVVPDTIEPYFANVKGMQTIKEELGALYHCLHQKNGDSIPVPYNFIISGQPGSGKSMLARIIAKILYDNKLTQEAEPMEINAISLLENVSLLEESDVIIINNAECLWTTEQDAGKNESNRIWLPLEAILEKACEDRKHFYIFLGEPESMDSLLRNNAKLKNYVTYLKIPIYSSSELHQIGLQMLQKDGHELSKEASEQFYQQIRRNSSLGDFANGHSIRNLAIEAKKNMGYRVADGGDANEFEVCDFIMQNDNEESLEQLREKLNAMIGLQKVKEEVEQKIIFYQERENSRKEGIISADEEMVTLNTLLLGPPGTGKTTVARLLGKIYGQIGILPRGDIFVEVTREGLVAGYAGQTALKVDELIKRAMGGVLFIDEAYNLVTGDQDEFGKEAINTLLTRAENYRDRLMIIMAGYEEPMRQLLAANEGMKRRFPNELHFESYTEEELEQIFNSMLKSRDYVLHMDAKKSVRRLIKSRMGRNDFGNAGDIRNMIDGMVQKLAVRVYTDKTNNIGLRRTICKVDVENYIGKNAEEKTLDDYLDELDALIGLEGVKKHIREEIKASRIAQERCRRAGVDYSPGSLHMLLMGNAGTGKTTVARLIGKIYGKAGLIKNEDVFVEIRRESLVAGYMGQTGLKVAQEVDKARGGILFIDEAYNLVNGHNDEFGREALNTLLASIENNRDDLMVIMAGYEAEMEQLLDNNQGLRSRMNTTLYLEDYSKEQMREIFYSRAKENGYVIEEGLETVVEGYLIREKENARSDFGNARGVRNCYERVVKRMNARICSQIKDSLSDEDLAKITDKELNTILKEDIVE